MSAEQFEHFTLDGVLGSGSFGTVYRGTDVRDGTVVAIKVLDRAEGDAPLSQLRVEAAAMLKIADPHCVRVLDVIEGPPPAIVTEYVHGAPLRMVLDSVGRLTGPQALDVIRGALLGLAAVHRAGLLHGDFKPDNILVDRRGVSRLIDFGLTRTPVNDPGGAAITGSPAYMSPEQVRGGRIDRRCDLYACAVVLFELVTGQRPFTGNTADAVMRRHIDDPAPNPRDTNRDVSAQVAAVCRTGLAKNPDDRYQSAADFLAALEQAARQSYGVAWATGTGLGAAVGATLAAPTAAIEPARGGRPRRRARAPALAATGVIAAVVAVVVLAVLHAHRHAQASERQRTAAPSSSSSSVLRGGNALGSTSATFAAPRSMALNSYYAVSCPTSQTCVATGQTAAGRPIVSVTSNAGITWTTTFPAVAGTLGLLSCSDTRRCVAGYFNGAIHMRRTVDGGGTWLAAVTPRVTNLQSISCPTASQCLAVGGAEQNGDGTPQGIATRDAGRTWHLVALPGPAKSVSCADARHCWVAGAAVKVWATDVTGTSWRPVSPPLTFPPPQLGRGPFAANTVFPVQGRFGELGFYVEGVAFSSDNDGIAFGGALCGGAVTKCASGVYRTTDGAKTWNFWSQTYEDRYGIGRYATCIDAACLMVTGTFSKSVLISTADGQTWTQRRDFGRPAGRVTCSKDATTCIVIGQLGLWVSHT